MTKEKLSQYTNRTQNYCGVYFLYKGNDLVYIGRSCNILRRMKAHIGTNKDWDLVKWVVTPNKLLSVDIEHAIIMTHPTPYNKVPKIVKSVPKLYSLYISDCRHVLKLYDEMKIEDEFRNRKTKYSSYVIKNLNYFKENVNMALDEFEIEYDKKIKGEQHKLTKPSCVIRYFV